MRPEESMEADYERLLQRAWENRANLLATLEGFEPSIFTLKG